MSESNVSGDGPVSGENMEEVLDLIYAGQKIQACKRYMELRGVDLLEAKNFVESLTESLRVESPEKFKAASKSGCATVLLSSVLVGTVVLWAVNIC